MITTLVRIAALVLALLTVGCGRDQAAPGAAGPNQPVSPTREMPREATNEGASAVEFVEHDVVFSRDVAPILERYCMSCHDQAAAEGGVVLDVFGDQRPGEEYAALLLKIAANLRSESMPPEGEQGPNPAELAILNGWLDKALSVAKPSTGRISIRRLNRAEYNNTIRDLIGIDPRPADEFPSDDVGYGFDNIADVLSTPPVLVEMNMAAAESVIAAAFASPAVRQRIMNPPADTIPPVFRQYKAAVRVPRETKVLRTFPPVEDPEKKREQRIYDMLRGFADRAFRRPARHEELLRLFGMVIAAEKDGESPEIAIQVALRAVLTSPYFLFLGIEPPDQSDASWPLLPDHDFDLAARLSYFLWSSMPDDELSRLAAQGVLRERRVLASEVMRMLGDPKSRALAENFGAQWLETRKLAQLTPDPDRFPDFDPALKAAMQRETELFFASILGEDRSVLDFLDADYTFVNDRLARHYGIAGVTGASFRRISLAGTPRGGVLTHASVLVATSNPTRTSPVKRGKWILENILGTPPSPPPSGVEALVEGRESAAAGSLRQRMEQHRKNPACASCHRRMDPLGFGLENFDAVGKWRNLDCGNEIDASGQLPGARTFRGPAELKAALRARSGAFVRTLTEKMLTYALGSGVDRADRRVVDQIASRVAREGYRFSSLVLGIVESEPFQRQNTPGKSP